ncbi:hypothetical protein thsps21_18400 [Pseudomonas sp. No.21]|jgi:hypothetical protein|uniref:Uncharacterized protein n=1 Tax=Pseudomonas tohonis TaxID=2725477 RepID=A0A6J4E2B5_9PSED|nr:MULTISPECIES: hypothetical protein [Pseudomonas]MDW3714719.1 hypothetical protein [Pseudomonas sp. 2023EL-01195]UXY54857.1 hypothetical protein N9L84_09895 [Pseudomonas tohonis]BBP82344.1 hypothetical protein PHLH8_19860 [Pseudomonas sp. Pc102]BCG23892.1 hypothetical protein TUM18999_20830 [Pseudomonas tohonis]GJN47731.1 hypothetical protein TUM20249_37170 [Pseudomonas tohonis]
MKEQRTFLALRAHIDELLRDGARIISRDPLTLKVSGHLYRVNCGMLISHSAAA